MVPMVYKTVVKEKFITQWRHVVLGRLPDSDPKVETDESFRRCSSDAKDKKREKCFFPEESSTASMFLTISLLYSATSLNSLLQFSVTGIRPLVGAPD